MGLFLFGHPFKAIRRAEIENTAVRCFPAPRSARRHGCAARSTSIAAEAEESRRARQMKTDPNGSVFIWSSVQSDSKGGDRKYRGAVFSRPAQRTAAWMRSAEHKHHRQSGGIAPGTPEKNCYLDKGSNPFLFLRQQQLILFLIVFCCICMYNTEELNERCVHQ